jgi:hypothetical protein
VPACVVTGLCPATTQTVAQKLRRGKRPFDKLRASPARRAEGETPSGLPAGCRRYTTILNPVSWPLKWAWAKPCRAAGLW